MNKSLFDRVIILLLLILNALFLVYWIELTIHYCLHYDDVHFMWKMRDVSIAEYVKEMYLTRGGNFIGYGLNGVIFTISNWLGFYQFWPMLFYILGILMTFFAFKDIVCSVNKWIFLLCAITLYNLYVLTSIDFAVFTWLCAMGYYLFAPALCLLLKYINTKEFSVIQWLVMIALSLFISGGAVSFSTLSFVVLFANGMILWGKHNWNIKETWKDERIKKLLMITLLMLVVFVVVVLAPGNYSRMENESDIEQPNNLFEFIIACGKCVGMFLYLTSFYIPYYIIVIALGYYFGNAQPTTIKSFKGVLYICLVYLAYLLISVMPLAYLSNGFAIQRNYTQLTYFLLLALFSIGFIFGNVKKQILSMKVIGCVSCIFLIFIMVVNLKQDIPVAIKYYNAHIEREAMLLQLNEEGNTDTIIVEPYPSVRTPDSKYNVLKLMGKKTPMQAIYYAADTNMEPNEYEDHLKRLLKLNFDFVLSSKSY